MFFLERLSRFSEVVSICEGLCRGVFKRVDENRELLELLQDRAPDFLAQHPWVEGWIEGNDKFLSSLASAVGTKNTVTSSGIAYPRPWPGGRVSERPKDEEIDLQGFSAQVHLRANAAMFEGILQAFQKTALEYGFTFSRDKSQMVVIDFAAKRALGKAVLTAKWRFVAPLYWPKDGLERAEEEQEDIAWTNSIVDALCAENVFVAKSKTAPTRPDANDGLNLAALIPLDAELPSSAEITQFLAAAEEGKANTTATSR